MIECIEQKGGMNKYNFVCEACGDEYELKVSNDVTDIGCDRCGTRYFQHNDENGKPVLVFTGHVLNTQGQGQ